MATKTRELEIHDTAARVAAGAEEGYQQTTEDLVGEKLAPIARHLDETEAIL